MENLASCANRYFGVVIRRWLYRESRKLQSRYKDENVAPSFVDNVNTNADANRREPGSINVSNLRNTRCPNIEDEREANLVVIIFTLSLFKLRFAGALF